MDISSTPSGATTPVSAPAPSDSQLELTTKMNVGTKEPPFSPWNALFEKDPWNVDLWLKTLNDVRKKGNAEELRQLYERFLWQFPTSAKHWIMYLEFEVSQANYLQVQEIFTRCLRQVVNVQLWKFYLDYIRRVNVAKTPENRSTIVQAYEFALQHVGLDVEASTIWLDFIEYVKSWPIENPFEQGLQTETLRKVYHRAISIPNVHIEQIWKDYDGYENGLNKMTAKKNISEKSASYMTARASLRELKNFHDVLVFDNLQVPPSWSEQEMKILKLWKQWIEWEKSNPLRYAEDSSINARIIYAYRKAMANLRFYPSIWVETLSFLLDKGEKLEAQSLAVQALEANPSSLLVTFYAAEIDEDDKRIEEGKRKFDKLVEILQEKVDIAKNEYNQALKEFQDKFAKSENSATMNGKAEHNESSEDEYEDEDQKDEKDLDAQNLKFELLDPKRKSLENIQELANLSWIQYMKYCRRVEASQMEYFCNKDKTVAFKIFEVGMKLFGDNADYIAAYMDFLIATTDDANVRSLFERSVVSMDSEKAMSLWKKFMTYENDFGEFSSVQNLAKRYKQVYPNETYGAQQIASRFSYMNLDNIFQNELGICSSVSAWSQNLQDQFNSPAIRPKAKGSHASDIVILPATKEEELLYPAKKKSLQSVGKGKFTKPDLSQYNLFVPDPDRAKDIELKRKDRYQRLVREPSPAGSVQSSISMPQSLSNGQLHPILFSFFNRLPPAQIYNGPVFNVDVVIDVIARANIPSPPSYVPSDGGRSAKRRR